MPAHRQAERAGPAREVWRLLTAAVRRFGRHHLTDWGAALTYYSILSVFPALVVIVSLLGLIGGHVTGGMIENFRAMTPGPARDLLIAAIQNVQSSGTTAGAVLAASLTLSLYSASSYVGAFMRASNVVWGVRERRRFYQLIPLRLGVMLLLVLLIVGVVLVVVVTGPLAGVTRQALGLSRHSLLGSALLKWPLLLALMATTIATLYNVAPYGDRRRFRILTAGSLLAIALWLAASAVFTIYVASFNSYNRTFGSLAGVIVFIVWLWLANVSLLVGVELDFELDRYRRVHGVSAFRRRSGERPARGAGD